MLFYVTLLSPISHSNESNFRIKSRLWKTNQIIVFLLYFVYFSPSLNLRVSILSQLVPIRNWNREPTIWTCIIWTPSLGREEQRNNRDFFLNFLLSPFARLRNGVLLKQQRIINPSKKKKQVDAVVHTTAPCSKKKEKNWNHQSAKKKTFHFMILPFECCTCAS